MSSNRINVHVHAAAPRVVLRDTSLWLECASGETSDVALFFRDGATAARVGRELIALGEQLDRIKAAMAAVPESEYVAGL